MRANLRAPKLMSAKQSSNTRNTLQRGCSWARFSERAIAWMKRAPPARMRRQLTQATRPHTCAWRTSLRASSNGIRRLRWPTARWRLVPHGTRTYGYFYSAIAEFHLGRVSDAEKSANQTIVADLIHRIPQAHLLLVQIYAAENDVHDAIIQLRAYLKVAPNSPDAARERKNGATSKSGL